MSRESFLILLGVLVILSPFSGLPLSWLSWILPIVGALVIIIGAWIRRERALRNRAIGEIPQP